MANAEPAAWQHSMLVQLPYWCSSCWRAAGQAQRSAGAVRWQHVARAHAYRAQLGRALGLSPRGEQPSPPAAGVTDPVVVVDLWGDVPFAQSVAVLHALGLGDGAQSAIRCVAGGPLQADALVQQVLCAIRPAVVVVFDAQEWWLHRPPSAALPAPTTVAVVRRLRGLVLGLVCSGHAARVHGEALGVPGEAAYEPFAMWSTADVAAWRAGDAGT